MESSDMCFEILTRTSLRTLDRCKSVCKAWNYLMYESNFMPLHCKRSNTVFGYLIQMKSSTKFVSIVQSTNDLSLTFLPEKVNILASSNQGILLCASENVKVGIKYYVCKPSTKQFEVVPNPNTEVQLPEIFALVVLQSNPLRYKIVRLSRPNQLISKNQHYNYGCEILDSQTWCWKEYSGRIWLPDGVEPAFVHHPVVLGNEIHWLLTNNCVLTFNAAADDDDGDEIFTTFSPPKSCGGDFYPYKRLVEFKGRLGLCERLAKGGLRVWVLADCKNKVWDEGRLLNLDGALTREEPLASFATLYNADIAVLNTYKSTLFYNFQSRTFQVVRLDDLLTHIFPFRSDMESVDLKGGQ